MRNRVLIGGLAAVIVLTVAWLFTQRDEDATPLVERVGSADDARAQSRQGALDFRDSKEVAERSDIVGAADPELKTGKLLVRVWFGSGSTREPASAFPVIVRPYFGIDTAFGETKAETNANGEVLIERLRPGPVIVVTGNELPWFKQALVRPEATAEVDLEMEKFVEASGIVVDDEDRPIAGATIEAVRIEQAASPFPVGKSGPDGRFTVTGIPEIGAIGARAGGFVAAPLHSVDVNGQGKLEVEFKIVLARGGGSVSGVVYDSAGEPLEDARVRVGAPRARELFHRIKLADGSKGFERAAIEARTDAQGQFRITGLSPGTQPVVVRGRDAAPWTGSCEVAMDSTTSMQIHLREGVTCEGTVLMADGRPAQSCRVWADTVRRFLCPEVLTDENGTFRLTGIAPGKVSMRAALRRVERAKVEFVADSGETRTWNPKLGGGVDLLGRVVTVNGRPMSQVEVEVLEDPRDQSGEMRQHQTTTDAEGRFVIKSVEPGPILFITVLTGMQQPVMRARVDAAEGECLVKVPDPGMPTATISGSVRSSDGALLSAATINLRVATNTRESAKPDTSGRFQFGELFRGPYTVQVQAPGYVGEARTKDLAEGEHWVLDDIELERSGWVVVPLAGVPDDVRDRLSIMLRSDDSTAKSSLDCSMRTARSIPIRPGKYRLEVGGTGVAAASVPVQVQPGGPTEARVPVVAGARCALTVHLPKDAGMENDVALKITGPRGVALDRNMPPAMGRIRPLECCLAPGDYEIRAALADGRAGISRVKIDRGAAAPREVTVRVE